MLSSNWLFLLSLSFIISRIYLALLAFGPYFPVYTLGLVPFESQRAPYPLNLTSHRRGSSVSQYVRSQQVRQSVSTFEVSQSVCQYVRHLVVAPRGSTLLLLPSLAFLVTVRSTRLSKPSLLPSKLSHVVRSLVRPPPSYLDHCTVPRTSHRRRGLAYHCSTSQLGFCVAFVFFSVASTDGMARVSYQWHFIVCSGHVSCQQCQNASAYVLMYRMCTHSTCCSTASVSRYWE